VIVEQRTFNFYPGKVAAYLALYRDEGRAIQERHLGESLGVFVSECGPLNQVIVLWKFDSYAHRDKVRHRMKSDPVWKSYLEKIHPLMLSMENRIWVRADIGARDERAREIPSKPRKKK